MQIGADFRVVRFADAPLLRVEQVREHRLRVHRPGNAGVHVDTGQLAEQLI
jgi:hypothetical protein